MTAPKVAVRKIDDLTPDPRNARTHSESQIGQLVASIKRFGWTNPILADDMIRAGHGRLMAAKAIYAAGEAIYLAPGKERGGKRLAAYTVPVIDCTGWTEDERKAYSLADNQLALQAGWDTEILFEQLDELRGVDFALEDIGFDVDALAALNQSGDDVASAPLEKSGAGSLVGEFLTPPFTVLSARDGWWMNRKKAWLALGIRSEVGRGQNVLDMSASMAGLTDPAAIEAWNEKRRKQGRTFGQDLLDGDDIKPQAGVRKGRNAETDRKGLGGVTMDALSSHPRYYEQKTAAEKKLGRKLTAVEFERDHWVLPDSELSSGTSIFDPVLCELAYRWFSPVGGRVLDPFSGGSVRGIVAAVLGRSYTGIDLRAEQIEANQEQWPTVAAAASAIDGAAPLVDPRWVAGDSNEVLAKTGRADKIGGDYDFVFSCPPYGDLEVYSDDPSDLSTFGIEAFDQAYAEIIAKAVARLADDRFACFVVGDYRDKKGIYANFVSKTIAAFEAAGARLYNEAILVTSVGSLPIRAAKQFRTTRKLGKTHQNILVFVKGDPRKATEACGPVDVSGSIELAERNAEGDEAE